MNASSIPFKIPSEFLTDFAAGNVVRSGALLKDLNTGKIVGHLQETGVLSNALNAPLSFDPTGATGLIGVAQNAQLNKKLNQLQSVVGNIELLQIANLASSVVGVGVTVASTALILNRISQLSEKMYTLENSIQSLPKQYKQLNLRTIMVEVKTSLQRFENSKDRKDRVSVISKAEEKLHYCFDQIIDGVNYLCECEDIDLLFLSSLLASASICGSAQTKALMWMDEVAHGKLQAERQYYAFEQINLKMPHDLLKAKTASNSATIDTFFSDLREIRYRIGSNSHLMQKLIELQLSGAEYLKALESEKKQPILVLIDNV